MDVVRPRNGVYTVRLVGGPDNGLTFHRTSLESVEIMVRWEDATLVQDRYARVGEGCTYRYWDSRPDLAGDTPPWPEIVYAGVAWEGETWLP
jgi:hypothetical protein